MPIRTFCPPAIDRSDPTVREPRVVVPIPPLETVRGFVKERLVMVALVTLAFVKFIPAKIGLLVVVKF